MKNPVKLVYCRRCDRHVGSGAERIRVRLPHHHTEAKSHVHQHSSVDNDQTSSATTGDNLVGNFFGQTNLDLFSFLNNNHAVGVAALSTGDATAATLQARP